MFLADKKNVDFNLCGATELTVKNSYRYYVDFLLEFCIKLFTIEGLPESIPEKEILSRCFLFGTCGIVETKETGLIAVRPNLHGVTNYFDEFTHFTWATPLWSGDAEIGKTGVLIDANELRNELFPKIRRYALMLSHCDVTLTHNLVNGRSNMVIRAITSKFAKMAKDIRRKQYNGELDVYVDAGFDTLNFIDTKSSSVSNYMGALDTRNELLNNFMEELGIKRTNQKRERMVVEEVSAGDELLLLNINNMYETMKKGIEEMNRVFGTSASIICNVDYEKGDNIDNESDRITTEDNTVTSE